MSYSILYATEPSYIIAKINHLYNSREYLWYIHELRLTVMQSFSRTNISSMNNDLMEYVEKCGGSLRLIEFINSIVTIAPCKMVVSRHSFLKNMPCVIVISMRNFCHLLAMSFRTVDNLRTSRMLYK